jgi:putative addiction module killer protein
MFSEKVSPFQFHTAGIRALNCRETFFSPHALLVQREREHVSQTISKSIAGMLDLAAMAKTVINGHQQLARTLTSGQNFFFGEQTCNKHLPPEQTHELRQTAYTMGREYGFESLAKKARRRGESIISVDGYNFRSDHLVNALVTAQGYEQQRHRDTNRIISALRAMRTRIQEDPPLQQALCALFRREDWTAFTEERAKAIEHQQGILRLWLSRSTIASEAFVLPCPMEPWLPTMVEVGEKVASSEQLALQTSLESAYVISPIRKATLAKIANHLLDDLARLARTHSGLRESPIKDGFRIQYLLTELSKPLPDDVKTAHLSMLHQVTERFLRDESNLVIVLAIVEDDSLSETERNRFLDHIRAAALASSSTGFRKVFDPSYEDTSMNESVLPNGCDGQVPSIPKRTEVRREVREALQERRVWSLKEELLSRISDLQEFNPTPRAPEGATLRFFPPRLENDFKSWTCSLSDIAQTAISELLQAALRGAQVDFKPINTEKKMMELRLAGLGYRIYFTRSKQNQLVVLGFGAKEDQKQDILIAKERFRRFTAED